jgi:hypothetical protein
MKFVSCLFALTLPLSAAINITLPGSTESSTWVLNSTNYTPPDYPAGFAGPVSAWGAAAAPTSGSSSALLNKVSGGGGFFPTYMYTEGSIGSFRLYDDNPLASLQTLVFQGNLSADVAPVLNINGGAQSIAATYFYQSEIPGYDDFAYQWDLSAAGPITSYEILFSGHFAATSLKVDTGSSFSQVVPEPSSFLLGCSALAFTLIRRRRA